jgi:hypothetical protein
MTTAAAPTWNLAATPVPLAAAFERLAKEWEDETGMFSRTDQIAMHPAYQRIIGLGPAALPLILEALRRQPKHWFWALAAITGENPVPPEDQGRIDKMAAAWIAWGQEQGLIR